MATPTLTKLQKKLSLSGKKQKSKREIIKNVVANPQSCYWPLVCNELETLVKVLTENLPRVKPKKVNVPWHILKNVSKENRQKARTAYIQEKGNPEIIVNEKNMLFGVNEVTKCLECNSCVAVLVAELNPRILVQHIVDLAILYNVPVLVVPGIKPLLKECCGLESNAVAVRQNIPKGSNLDKIVEIITEVHKNYPADQQQTNLCRIERIQKSEVKIDGATKFNLPTNKTKKKASSQRFHLHKSSLNTRVFVPELSENGVVTKSPTTDFLSFNNSVDSANLINISKKIRANKYKPLKLKRLKGNKDRQTDKIKKLKKNKLK